MASWPDGYAVLAVEDDENHAALIRMAFAYRKIGANVHVASSAEEAVSYLLGGPPFHDRTQHPFPDVIVLDVNMPGLGGMGFLEWLAEPQGEAEAVGANDVPVVVFTSLHDPELPARCFALGAREFKLKPTDFDELVDLVHRVMERWRPRPHGQLNGSV